MTVGKNKKVSFSEAPISDKSVKHSKNPDTYKSQPICWQLSLMDFDFQYGWNNVINRINFTQQIKDDILLEIAEDDDNELYGIIDKINVSSFKTRGDLFAQLCVLSHVNSKHIVCILSKLKETFFWKEIYPKMKNFESITWQELENQTFFGKGKTKTMHHWVSTARIIKEAKERLKEIKLDDYDEIYSIRLSGTNRVWGIRINNYFRILWFDFDHEICPSMKS